MRSMEAVPNPYVSHIVGTLTALKLTLYVRKRQDLLRERKAGTLTIFQKIYIIFGSWQKPKQNLKF